MNANIARNKTPLQEELRKFFRGEVIFHILFWAWFFLFANVNWTANWFDRAQHISFVAPLSAILTPIAFYGNVFWTIPTFLRGKKWYRYFIVTFGILIGFELLRTTIYTLLGPSELPLTARWPDEFFSRNNTIIGLPNSLLSAFFFAFAYRFTKDWVLNSRLIQKLKNEKMAMELSLLKSQMNPHFLFNNLNALDDLIDRDKDEAKAYLQQLSKYYRYSIVNMEEDLVNLQDDWNSIDHYLYLMEARFGKAYRFQKTIELDKMDAHYIVPGALQSLIENVVKHNQGSVEKPLLVNIIASESGVSVSHEKRPKRNVSDSLGTGLKNLASRYLLLSDQEIAITNDTNFTVNLPLISIVNE